MAIRILHSVEIARDPSACWALFSDVAGWPRWFPLLEAAQRARAGELAPGESIVLRLTFAGRGIDVPVRVEEVEPGRRVRWIGRNLGVTGDHQFLVEPTATGARFTSEER